MPREKLTRRKDGRYREQIYIGTDENGKKRYKNVYGKTPSEVKEKALAVRLQLSKGIDIIGADTSFAVIADAWVATKAMDVSSQYYKTIKSKVEFIKDYLGDMPISQITTAHIQQIINDLSKSGRTKNGERGRVGKPSAKKTLVDYRNIASQIFEMAIENRFIDYNPAKYVRIPSKAPKSERFALTEKEQNWINEFAHPAQLPAMIMLYAGLRKGELIPLQWKDIDLNAGTITVNKSVEVVNGRYQVKPGAKTEAGERVVYIPQRLIDFLSKAYEASGKNPFALVCPGKNGQMMTESGFRRMWESYIRDLNFKYGNRLDKKGNLAKSKFNPNGVEITIRKFTPHCLRHTFATLLYFAGVDVVTAKEQLGHADIKTTLAIYTHLDQKHKKKNIKLLNDYLEADTGQVQVSQS